MSLQARSCPHWGAPRPGDAARSGLAGVNVTGCHLHFITADRQAGGHLLDCRIESGKVMIGNLENF